MSIDWLSKCLFCSDPLQPQVMGLVQSAPVLMSAGKQRARMHMRMHMRVWQRQTRQANSALQSVTRVNSEGQGLSCTLASGGRSR